MSAFTHEDLLENFTISQRQVWFFAYREGLKCGKELGEPEQNPYDLEVPLYEAWHYGWLDQVQFEPWRHIVNRTAKDIQERFIYNQQRHLARVRRFRLSISKLKS